MLGIAAAAAGPWLLRRVVAARSARWRADLGRGAPAAARAMADALAGGHAIRGAMTAAGTAGGVPGAAGAELRDAAHAFELGERTEVVLERLRRRAADPRWDTIVAAILLQREAGGDLARLLREHRHRAGGRRARRGRRPQPHGAGALHRVARDARSRPARPALAELAQPGYLLSLARTPLTAALVVVAVGCQIAAAVLVRRIARLEGA